MAGFIAFYDANVLYPAELRNVLMHLALTGLFRAKWSAEVHEEWISSLLKKRSRLRVSDSLASVPQSERLPCLGTFGIEARHPDDFVFHLLKLAPDAEYLETLERQGLTETVPVLREYMF